MESTLPQTASTVLINLSLAWTAGVLAARFWLLKPATAWQRAALAQLSGAMPAGLASCIAGIVLLLWSEASAMGDVPWLAAWPACKEMLTSTHYGHAGVAALALLTLAMLAHRVLRHSGAGKRYVGSVGLLLLLVLAARVTISHAFEHGFASVAFAMEWLHLLFMSIWTGIVFVAGWLVLSRVPAAGLAPASGLASYLASMSDWASAALLGVMATGAYNAWRTLGSPRDLLDADYGRVLAFKLCMVVLAVALGAFNKFFGLPAATSANTPAGPASGVRMVVSVLRIESVALLLALGAAAILSNSAPPSA